MATAKRIYVVTEGEAGDSQRLVRASNPSQAITHVVKSIFKATVATQDELVTLASAGHSVEETNEATA